MQQKKRPENYPHRNFCSAGSVSSVWVLVPSKMKYSPFLTGEVVCSVSYMTDNSVSAGPCP